LAVNVAYLTKISIFCLFIGIENDLFLKLSEFRDNWLANLPISQAPETSKASVRDGDQGKWS